MVPPATDPRWIQLAKGADLGFDGISCTETIAAASPTRLASR